MTKPDIAVNLVSDMNKTLSVFVVNRVLLNLFQNKPLFKLTQHWTKEIFASYLGLQLYHQFVFTNLKSNLVSNLAKVCIVTFVNAVLTDGFKPLKFLAIIIITVIYSLFIESYATKKLGEYIKDPNHATAIVESIENGILLSIDEGSGYMEMLTSSLSIFMYHAIFRNYFGSPRPHGGTICRLPRPHGGII
jgi:hypothetical protein